MNKNVSAFRELGEYFSKNMTFRHKADETYSEKALSVSKWKEPGHGRTSVRTLTGNNLGKNKRRHRKMLLVLNFATS